MRTDFYTKCVLTVIAVCLMWLSLGGPSLLSVVQAQPGAGDTHVMISGWVDQSGNVHRLRTTGILEGVPVREVSSRP